MNKKLAIIIAVTLAIWTLVMMCAGVFGAAIQGVMIPVCLEMLKWTGVLIGYAIAFFLPVRIFNALASNAARRKLLELQQEAEEKHAAANQEALRQRAVEEAILKAYYKEEDDV